MVKAMLLLLLTMMMVMMMINHSDRWRSSAMELILTSFLSPILWAIPQGAVQNMMINLHPTDLTQVYIYILFCKTTL